MHILVYVYLPASIQRAIVPANNTEELSNSSQVPHPKANVAPVLNSISTATRSCDQDDVLIRKTKQTKVEGLDKCGVATLRKATVKKKGKTLLFPFLCCVV